MWLPSTFPGQQGDSTVLHTTVCPWLEKRGYKELIPISLHFDPEAINILLTAYSPELDKDPAYLQRAGQYVWGVAGNAGWGVDIQLYQLILCSNSNFPSIPVSSVCILPESCKALSVYMLGSLIVSFLSSMAMRLLTTSTCWNSHLINRWSLHWRQCKFPNLHLTWALRRFDSVNHSPSDML